MGHGVEFVVGALLAHERSQMATMRTLGKADDWTIKRWRTEPRLVGLQFSDSIRDASPPLWKDLAVAVVVLAIALLAVAAFVRL